MAVSMLEEGKTIATLWGQERGREEDDNNDRKVTKLLPLPSLLCTYRREGDQSVGSCGTSHAKHDAMFQGESTTPYTSHSSFPLTGRLPQVIVITLHWEPT